MSETIDDYRCNLINKILLAPTRREVECTIESAIINLKEHDVNDHIVSRFMDKAIEQLNLLGPMTQDVQQWNNVKVARIQLKHLKRLIEKNESS